MRSLPTSIGAALLGCLVGHAAALVPVPGSPTKLPTPGFEPNRGQAKPEILFLSRGSASLAVTPTAILISPYGARQEFVLSRPDPQVRYSDPLPGIANYYTGPDTSRWFTAISRYATARLSAIYPGVDAEYHIGADGMMQLTLLFAAGIDPAVAAIRVDKAYATSVNMVGELVVQLGNIRLSPKLVYPVPRARQGPSTSPTAVQARFEVRPNQQFGFTVDNRDPALPLEIEITINLPTPYSRVAPRAVQDSSGNLFVAATVPDLAGGDPPFPDMQRDGCGTSIATPYACTDVAVSKFTPQGQLAFVTYLSGRTSEMHGFLQRAPDGALVVAGTTDSSNFPVTSGALQTQYGGPPAPPTAGSTSDVKGDYFAALLDSATGALRASTYLGGPNEDVMGEAALGADGSLYFFHKWLVASAAGMPTTRGALQAACQGDPCPNGYAAHLTPMLDRLLYGTYLPGTAHASAVLHHDGSLYYAGSALPGFPTTPNAYQRLSAGGEDAIFARLDPTGSTLLFATYLGTKDTDWILRMAVAPDGSAWVHISSFVQCCIDIRYALVRLDSRGERVLVRKPIDIGDIAVDRDGNLIATAFAPLTASPEAFQLNSCGAGAYLKLSPAGEQLFASYLPSGFSYDFAGVTPRGTPILQRGEERFEVVEDQSAGVFTGCIVDGASFIEGGSISPGALVTLFGSQLGPREGAAFQLTDGRLPTFLGGTRVLVNGEAVPLLYSSYSQVNALMPYTLTVGTRPEVQVISGGNPGNVLSNSYAVAAGVSIFRIDDSALRPAAALNEDGTVNSMSNPAKPGSRIALFGTGGGATNPPSIAGEITPLELRPIRATVTVSANGTVNLPVEYAGAAPGLLSGVVQVNVKLPDSFPASSGIPPGTLSLQVQTGGASFYPGTVSIFVSH